MIPIISSFYIACRFEHESFCYQKLDGFFVQGKPDCIVKDFDYDLGLITGYHGVVNGIYFEIDFLERFVRFGSDKYSYFFSSVNYDLSLICIQNLILTSL